MLLQMLRIMLFLALLPAKHFEFGPIEFDADADGVVVRYHGHDWTPDLSKLAIQDCEPLAWDDLNEVLYFSAATASGDLILGYDLRSDRIDRVVTYRNQRYESNGVVSPLGRYIALIALVGVGTCGSFLVVVDVQEKNLRTIPLPAVSDGEAVRLTNLRWTGSTDLEYSAGVWRKSDCAAALPVRKISGHLDVGPQK
jgi:hypothetical protein